MADEGTGQLGAIYEQIMAGDPEAFTTAGTEFKDALDALNEVEGKIPGEVDKLVGKDWKGPAATGFGKAADKAADVIGDTADAVGNPSWKTLLESARDALKQAQKDIQNLADQWNGYLHQNPPVQPDVEAFGKAAKEILDALSDSYDDQREAMKSPKDTGKGGDDGDKGEDDKGEDDKGEDDKGEDDKGEDDKGEDDKGEDDETHGVGDDFTKGGPVVGGLVGGKNLVHGPTPGDSDTSPHGDGFSSIGNPESPKSQLVFDHDGPKQPPELGNSKSSTGPNGTPSGSFHHSPGSPSGPGADPPGSSQHHNGGPDPKTRLTSLSNPAGGPSGSGGPGKGTGGTSSQLTSAGPWAGLVGGYGRSGPGVGAGRRPVGPGLLQVGSPVGVGGRRADEDEDEEREVQLLDDEEWEDDHARVACASIGRPGEGTNQ
jgi:hypothetical protein